MILPIPSRTTVIIRGCRYIGLLALILINIKMGLFLLARIGTRAVIGLGVSPDSNPVSMGVIGMVAAVILTAQTIGCQCKFVRGSSVYTIKMIQVDALFIIATWTFWSGIQWSLLP